MSMCRFTFAFLCLSLPAAQPALGDDAGRIWQQRHREYIDRIAKESIQQTAKNLNAHENMLVGVRIHPYHGTSPEFFSCLADRRLARLHSHLEALAKDEADQFCRKLFSEQLRRQRADFVGGIQAWKKGKPPTSPSVYPIRENWHALSAIVFLSATYCPIDETLRQVDEWGEMCKTFVDGFDFASMTDKPEVQAAIRTEFQKCAEPEPLFLFTLYAHMLRDRGALTNNELAEICPDREMMQDLAHEAHLVRWNSVPDSTASRKRGIYGKEDVIKAYSPFTSWCSAQYSEQKQRAAVAKLRARLSTLTNPDPLEE